MLKKQFFKALAVSTAGLLTLTTQGAPTRLVDEQPVEIKRISDELVLVDFGRVAFGNLRFSEVNQGGNEITVHFGEKSSNGRIDRKPPGTVRYNKTTTKLSTGSTVVEPPADKRNTRGRGKSVDAKLIPIPKEFGVVIPFRWVEIEGWEGELSPEQITRQSLFLTAWDDDSADFECSDEVLNKIWDLCKYSIKATTFAGIYVDGDRERIPYEADAYLNQLSHYYTDADKQIARDTYDHLMENPTWPTEWTPHMVLMAYADWMHTGDAAWLAPRYNALKDKLLMDRVEDYLVTTDLKAKRNQGDIVDWPPSERDGYKFTEINTVVNAFHIRAVQLMAIMAEELGRNADAAKYTSYMKKSHARFQNLLFKEEKGLYVDGKGTGHSSLHANLFPLAFQLVPPPDREKMADWLAGRGMKCSVYAAQYLLEALFENGADSEAIDLIMADGDRSWKHMVNSGTTITWEAWDMKYKKNQDWNHAWGAAPGNILPRYVLGAEPLEPGWNTARISPKIGGLTFAKGTVPTVKGPVSINWKKADTFKLKLDLPEGMDAAVDLPKIAESTQVLLNGEPVRASVKGERWIVQPPVKGSVVLEVK